MYVSSTVRFIMKHDAEEMQKVTIISREGIFYTQRKN